MLRVNHLIGFGRRRLKPSASYIGYAVGTTDTDVYNFGSFSAASAGLLVLPIAAQGTTGTSISSVTVGGKAATIAIAAGGSGIAYCEVEAGSHEVVVTFAAARQRAGVAAYLLTGYNDPRPASLGSTFLTSVTSIGVSLNIPPNGIALFAHLHANNSSTSWSSATSRVDTALEGTSNRFSVADFASQAGVAEHTETASWTTANNGNIGVAVWH